jgi:hypothetical protein
MGQTLEIGSNTSTTWQLFLLPCTARHHSEIQTQAKGEIQSNRRGIQAQTLIVVERDTSATAATVSLCLSLSLPKYVIPRDNLK